MDKLNTIMELIVSICVFILSGICIYAYATKVIGWELAPIIALGVSWGLYLARR